MADSQVLASELMQVAQVAAKAGGKIIKQFFGQEVTVRLKSSTEEVTQVDLDTEHVIRNIISTRYPEHTIRGEEFADQRGNSAVDWFIDPLDGTSNFVMGIPYVATCISVALHHQMILSVVYQPILEDTFSAILGKGAMMNTLPLVRSLEAPALDRCVISLVLPFKAREMASVRILREDLRAVCHRLVENWAPSIDWCLLSLGKIHGLVYISETELGSDPGMVAGALIFIASGGVITDLSGNPISDLAQAKSVVAATSVELCRQICRIVEGYPPQGNT